MSTMPSYPRTPYRASVKFLLWWYSISAPPQQSKNASLEAQEQVRRGRLASLMMLGTLGTAAILIFTILIAAPAVFVLSRTIPSIILAMFCCLIAIPFNRIGQVKITAILLLSAIYIAFAGIVLSEKSGLDPLFLSVFDLLVTTELIGVSLLSPASVFLVAFLNTLLIILDVNLQPHSMMWSQMIMSEVFAFSLLIRPIMLYLIVALVSYLWVKSALEALHRADRAEVIAALELREIESNRQLEHGIQQILDIHVRVANGDMNARASTQRDNVLWQISLALNNLLLRFQHALRAEKQLNIIMAEITQIQQALQAYRTGRSLSWQPPRIFLLAPLANDLTRLLRPAPLPGQQTLSGPMSQVQQPDGDYTKRFPQSPLGEGTARSQIPMNENELLDRPSSPYKMTRPAQGPEHD